MAGSKTILFIEDDPLTVDMYTHVLEKSGYQVEIAYSGKEGLEKAKSQDYDLILLDILLPEILGMEVLENLRGEEGHGLPNTKILVLTNLAQAEESKRALEAQADGYLIKTDVTPNKLVEIVTEVIGEADKA